jgi:ACS family hexuronate transporter-like MFS transporter
VIYSSSKWKIKHLRWWIVGLLFLSTVINYLSRQTLSVLQPIIQKEFNLTNTDYSHIVFAFMLAYMFMQTGFGRIVDWLGTRIGMTLAIVWWSLASILHAFAGSAMQFASAQVRRATGLALSKPSPNGSLSRNELLPPAFSTAVPASARWLRRRW